MIGRLALAPDSRAAAIQAMSDALNGFDRDRPVAVVSHFDADGLAAAAILVRSLTHAGQASIPLVVGKGETPWDPAMAARVGALAPGGLILADLGTRPEPVLPGCPTLVIDHHVPTGEPRDAVTISGTQDLATNTTVHRVISGNALSPEPTTALLAWWAVGNVGVADDLLWLAAVGLIGDMADAAGFPELTEAQRRWGKTALRDAVSLINAPRRTAAADAGPALRLLLQADGPKAITKGQGTDALALHAAKAEVRTAMEEAKRVPPLVVGDVALIQLDSACQIHPLIAQQWRGRLRDKIVIAANRGYRPGWVHFAARSASGRNLIDFLAEHRPPHADGRYGNGHAQATGGALKAADWNSFVMGLGIPQAQVSA